MRRRRQRLRVLALLVVVVALGVTAGYLAFGRTEAPQAPSAPPPAPPGVLVRVLEGEKGAALVLLQADDVSAVVLGMPANTLIQGPKGFEPLDDLLTAQGLQAVGGGLQAVVGAKPGAVATVSWEGLRTALPDAAKEWPAQLAGEGAEAGGVAAAALNALAQKAAVDRTVLDRVTLAGEGAAAAQEVLARLGAGAKVVEGLPGRAVEGVGFAYFEPDVAGAQALLGGSPAEKSISVEVQNGSGVVGIAQAVSDLVAPLGYTMLPARNADRFPDVETTQLLSAQGSLTQAERLRRLLGAGQVVRQDDLPPDRLVVITGKDLTLESLERAGPPATTP